MARRESSLDTAVTARNALVVVAIVAAGGALFWLREILTPFALALFLLLMIDGLARWVQSRTGVSARSAMALALVLIVLGFVGAVWVFVDGAAAFLAESARLGDRLNEVIADTARLFGATAPPTAAELVRGLNLQSYAGAVAGAAQGVIADAFFVLVYLGFLTASRAGFASKAAEIFATAKAKAEADEIFIRVRNGVEGYLWVQTVTGLMIAGAAWAIMTAVGLHNALFWAFVIFLVCYIPVIGGAIAGLAPPLFALVQFETYWQAAALLVGLQGTLFVVGNLIQPRMQGEDQNIDPVVVLLALAFWGALWGLPGMFLSTPLTVFLIAVLAEFPGTRWAAVLLSGDGKPYPKRDG